MKTITENVVVLDRGHYTTCTINFHGATVVSWRIRNLEQIFVSRETALDNKKIIRGGISFVFPQFGPWNFGPHHGFTRIKRWKLEKPPTRLASGDVETILSLMADDFTRSMWNYPFQLLYRITLMETELHLDITVKNQGKKLPFRFNLLLHTYLKVPDIKECQITGLQETTVKRRSESDTTEDDDDEEVYDDYDLDDDDDGDENGVEYGDETSLEGHMYEQHEEIPSSLLTSISSSNIMSSSGGDKAIVSINGWTEMLYPNTVDQHEIEHVVDDKTMIVQKRNLPDTLLWNPWSECSKDVPYFGVDEYVKMLCLKTGRIIKPVRLQAGQEFNAGLVLKLKCAEINPMYLFW